MDWLSCITDLASQDCKWVLDILGSDSDV